MIAVKRKYLLLFLSNNSACSEINVFALVSLSAN